MRLSLEEMNNFWDKVAVAGREECWQWFGNFNKDTGYGKFQVSRESKLKKYLAHRVAYRLTKGEIPEGVNILHTCDHRSCVNPNHLKLGTQHDNIQDRKERNRFHANVELELEAAAKAIEKLRARSSGRASNGRMLSVTPAERAGIAKAYLRLKKAYKDFPNLVGINKRTIREYINQMKPEESSSL